jgi:hypothetical protein
MRHAGVAKFALALAVVAAAYFYNLGTPSLWGDEAGTGLFARNVLQFGVPTAFDGRNLSIYDGGAELNAQMQVVKIPWIQFYLAALSVQLFGDTAQGLRAIFALLGVASLFPIWACLRNRTPMPLLLATLMLLSPQVLLFHRNARYYAVLTLLFALLSWLVCTNGLAPRRRLAYTAVLMVLLFHTHPVAASTCALALLLQAAWRRSDFSVYLGACLLGLCSWLLWLYALGPTLVAPQLFADFRGQTALDWPRIFAHNALWSFADLDAVQALPVLAWALGLLALGLLSPARLGSYLRDPLVGFVLLSLVLHVLLVATAFGTETEQHMALLRYMPHLIAMALAPLFILLAQLLPNGRLFGPASVALVASNLLTLSYWCGGPQQAVQASWWAPTYLEIAFPQPEAFDVARELIESDPGVSVGGLQTLAVQPQWLQENAIYYLGHKLIVQPRIPPGSASEAAVRARIGEAALARFQPAPTWVIDELPQAPLTVAGYRSIQFPVHRLRPDDGTRPELTRHTFYQNEVLGYATLYRRLD